MKMIALSLYVHIADLNGMSDFDWRWNKSEIKKDKEIKVFSTFSCGGVQVLDIKEPALTLSETLR